MRHLLVRAGMIVGAVSVLAGCGGEPQRGPGRREAGMYVQGLTGGQIIRPGASANEAYSAGIDLKKKGDCKAAVDKLTPVAGLGPGYENAQYALGDCLLALNSKGDAAQVLEAMMWLTRAANGGWTEAQGKLAEVYALGPQSQRNLDEAAYWLALYRGNATLARIGFTPMDAGVLTRITAAVGADRLKAAEARALTWEMKPWVPPPRATPEPGPEMRGMRGRRGAPPMEN